MGLEVIFGPPGTGKTTELSRLARQYVEGEGSDSVLVCAYTKTAARELAGRDLLVDIDHVGTLHSHCYHALDCPRIAESFYKDWNALYPVYALSAQKSLFQSDEPRHRFKLTGDEYLNLVNVLRHRMVPEDHWPLHACGFWSLWSRWKAEHGYYDFTDLIDKARTLFPVAPGRPKTLIVDEAQDLSLLQWDLLTHWGRHVTRFICAGDDDQALYRWAGADFRPLLAAEQRRILPQSYRVPARIQTYAERYVKYLTYRQPKTWQPRTEQGEVAYVGGSWEYAGTLLAQLDEWREPWGTLACIAPCAYMLTPLIEAFEAQGVPFGNPWRPLNHAWNPLGPAAHGMNALQRLLDFLRPPERLWTWQEIATWLPLIRSEDILHHGAKTHMSTHAEDTHICTLHDLETLFLPTSLAGVLHGGAEWLERSALHSQAKRLAYPLQVYRKHGLDALREKPPITIGTAHSLKGAEADTVVFLNDLSRSQRLALCLGGEEGEDVYRMLYVGYTRARESLYLVGDLGI